MMSHLAKVEEERKPKRGHLMESEFNSLLWNGAKYSLKGMFYGTCLGLVMAGLRTGGRRKPGNLLRWYGLTMGFGMGYAYHLASRNFSNVANLESKLHSSNSSDDTSFDLKRF